MMGSMRRIPCAVCSSGGLSTKFDPETNTFNQYTTLRASRSSSQEDRVGKSTGSCTSTSTSASSISSSSSSSSSSNSKASSKKKSKPYSVPGYQRGSLDIIQAVFQAHSIRDRMSFDAFMKSKYLRYWSGRKTDAEEIWCGITQSPVTDLTITSDQLGPLLLRLDEVSYQIEKEMQEERIAWEIEEMSHEFLENYFEVKSKGRKLSFSDFIAFENVQAEIWYNEKGLTENAVADIWETIAGCVSCSVDKATFLRIYSVVCGASYKF